MCCDMSTCAHWLLCLFLFPLLILFSLYYLLLFSLSVTDEQTDPGEASRQ